MDAGITQGISLSFREPPYILKSTLAECLSSGLDTVSDCLFPDPKETHIGLRFKRNLNYHYFGDLTILRDRIFAFWRVFWGVIGRLIVWEMTAKEKALKGWEKGLYGA
jgi:hypothetical protein